MGLSAAPDGVVSHIRSCSVVLIVECLYSFSFDKSISKRSRDVNTFFKKLYNAIQL